MTPTALCPVSNIDLVCTPLQVTGHHQLPTGGTFRHVGWGGGSDIDGGTNISVP